MKLRFNDPNLKRLSQMAEELPETIAGKRPRQTLTNWVVRGVDGVRLEALKIGGRWFSSVEALERFIAAVTKANYIDDDDNGDGRARPPAEPNPKAAQADQQAEELGV